MLTAKNNILWAEQKAAYTDGPFNEGNNIYWKSGGSPSVQFEGFSMSSTSKVNNPQFVNPTNQNFRVNSSSPAIDAGVVRCNQLDLDGRKAPQGTKNGIGAYELAASASTACP